MIIITNIRLINLSMQLNDRMNAIDANLQWLREFSAQPSQPALSPDMIVNVTWDDAATRGRLNAPIQIVEFSDFQCPFCAASLPVLERVMEKYPGQIVLAYRHFPLPGHTQAMPAAEAAECAREQGKFWEMHDLIFANQQAVGMESYRAFAEQLELNLNQFDTCLSEHRYEDAILQDVRDGQGYGVSGTPTFFINGHPIPGAADLVTFQTQIEQIQATAGSE
jgi:protein-disulfide isomerase